MDFIKNENEETASRQCVITMVSKSPNELEVHFS